MKRTLILVSVLAMTLAGCANKPSKVAPIDALPKADVAVEAPVPVTEAGTAKADVAVDASEATTRALRADELKAQPLVAEGAVQANQSDAAAAGSANNDASGQVAANDPAQAAGATPPLGTVQPSERVVYFDYDSAAIKTEGQGLLEAHGGYLKNHAKLEVLVQGHTDERGSREYNLALGQRRAESVKQALELLGVPEARIEAVSLGAEKPVAEGHDEAAWQQNRRAQVIYKDE